MSPINTNTTLESIHRLSPLQKKALSSLKLKTVHDLLRHFPVRYGETGVVKSIEFLTAGESVVVYGKITNLKTSKTFRSRVAISSAQVEDSTGKIKIVWFNQPYISKMFLEDSLVRIEGKVSEKRKKSNDDKPELYFSNPKIEKVKEIPEGTANSLFAENENHNLNPTYPESRGISSNWIYHALKKVFESGIDSLQDPIPTEILKKYNLPSLKTALIWIHTPRKKEDAEVARKRFAFEEIFMIQLDRQKERMLALKEKTFTIKGKRGQVDDFAKTFPFPLTNAQKNSISSILKDFESGHPMSRLLEGDVGSGKTAVAASASYAVVTTLPLGREAGNLQVAYMAPTEILAEQHFESFIEYFAKYKINIGLITGSGAKKFPSKLSQGRTLGTGVAKGPTLGWTKISKAQLLKWVANGEIPILIGTHTLIQKNVKFKNLAFIVIDEQHRFGVKQRKELRRKQDIAPHLLSMTATPIPRTLALTIFGDLDLSVLDELPAGRKFPDTKIVLPHERNEVYEKVREELRSGRQAYVICPRIDPTDPNNEMALNVKSVAEEKEYLQKKIFKEYKVGALTGKMTPKEKEEVMKDFKAGKYHILVTTSVVEVGVNVPNATVIIIENAERFGLAQLHQLRGRVLRSSHKPYCFVFASPAVASGGGGQKTIKRLHSFVNAKNGFELAEADLMQRGTGDLAGAKQWGISDLAMEALKNIKMVEAAREEARNILEKDFELKKYPLLKEHLSQKQAVHME